MIEIIVRGIIFFLLNCLKGKVEYSIHQYSEYAGVLCQNIKMYFI